MFTSHARGDRLKLLVSVTRLREVSSHMPSLVYSAVTPLDSRLARLLAIRAFVGSISSYITYTTLVGALVSIHSLKGDCHAANEPNSIATRRFLYDTQLNRSRQTLWQVYCNIQPRQLPLRGLPVAFATTTSVLNTPHPFSVQPRRWPEDYATKSP